MNVSFPCSDPLYYEIETFQRENEYSTLSDAIIALVRLGLLQAETSSVWESALDDRYV